MRVFPHRCNPDGTIDAICALCFRTIATRANEADLAPEEMSHQCGADGLELAAGATHRAAGGKRHAAEE